MRLSTLARGGVAPGGGGGDNCFANSLTLSPHDLEDADGADDGDDDVVVGGPRGPAPGGGAVHCLPLLNLGSDEDDSPNNSACVRLFLALTSGVSGGV